MAVTVRVVLFLSLFSTLMGHVDGSSPITASTEGKPMSKTEREAAEARFRAIHEECKGNVWKTYTHNQLDREMA